MVHIIASLAFMLIACASAGLIVFTLVDARVAIANALGMIPNTAAPISVRHVHIREVVRMTSAPAAMAVRRAA